MEVKVGVCDGGRGGREGEVNEPNFLSTLFIGSVWCEK